MKKEILIGSVSFSILIILCLIVWKLDPFNPYESSYGSYGNDDIYAVQISQDPDDDFSRNVMSVVSDMYYYHGFCEENGIINYEFKTKIHKTVNIYDIVQAANESSKCLDGKTEISLMDGPDGVWITMARLYNFSYDDSSFVEYDGFRRLRVFYERDYPWWIEPSLYMDVDNVIRLEIPDKMQEKADEHGIDWYEIWPDLEEVIVYETD